MEKKIKCIIWDLDNTIWDGILLEADEVKLKPGIKEILAVLEERGILNCIASRNDYEYAVKKLKEFDIEQYFIYFEINWNAKSISVESIQKKLNIGMNTILFIDDQSFELEEVKSAHCEVNVINASEYEELLSKPFLKAEVVTVDTKRRKQMYQENIRRVSDEENFKGPKKAFLESLGMKLIISDATDNDLKRAYELTIRANQLNATGTIYSYDELNNFTKSNKHELMICELSDKYGAYGKIGLTLIEDIDTHLYIRLLIMSCRVMSRSVGTILISFLAQKAKASGKKLLADFRRTDRNKIMYLTYALSNFKEVYSDDTGYIVFENDLSRIMPIPSYVEIIEK